MTGTLWTQAVKPSLALTWPDAIRYLLSSSDTLRAWSVITVKLLVLVAVPPGVVTVILPLVAFAGTVAVIWVAEFTVNVALTPLNLTEVVVKPVPLKFVPVMTTDVPTGPEVGVNEVMVGAGAAVTVKFEELVAVPLGLDTRIRPLVAVAGTVAVIWVAELIANVADTLANLTEVTVEKFVPVMTTDVPTGPEVGVNEVMVGAGHIPPTVKVPEL